MPLTQVSSRAIEDTLRYVLGASGTDHYTFTGKGLTGAVNDPTLTLNRGHTYIFENRNSNNAHPFYIKTSIANGGTNDAYNTGVTNNGGAGGTEIVFTVPHDAPDILYYQCSSHINMAGQLKIAGAVADGSITTSKIADNAVTFQQLASNTVKTGNIEGGAVITDRLADDAVTAPKIASDAVGEGQIQTGAVTVTKIGLGAVNDDRLANDAVTTNKIAAGAVSAAKIADATIGLDKLHHGTSSNDGKFLRANNGADPSYEAISSDFVKISSTTMSGEASEFDILFDNTTYEHFRIYVTGLNLSYDSNLYIRFRVGTTFITSNAYYGGTIKKYASGFDSNTYGGQHQSYGYLSHNVGGNDGTYERWSGIIDILCGNTDGMPFLRHDSFYKDDNGQHVNTMGIVGYQNWSILSGIRFYAASGNINHATFDVYGIK